MTEEEKFLAWYGRFLAGLLDEPTARTAYDAVRCPEEITTDLGNGYHLKWYLKPRAFEPVSH